MQIFPKLKIILERLQQFSLSSLEAKLLPYTSAHYVFFAVAFINIMKALTPAITLGISLLLGLERPSVLVAGALALIALGTGIATAQVRPKHNKLTDEAWEGCCMIF